MSGDLSDIHLFEEILETKEEFKLSEEKYDRAIANKGELRNFLDWRQRYQIRSATSWTIILLYGASVALTWTLVYLVAFGVATMEASFLQWLGGAILAELAPAFVLLLRNVWRTENSRQDEAPLNQG